MRWSVAGVLLYRTRCMSVRVRAARVEHACATRGEHARTRTAWRGSHVVACVVEQETARRDDGRRSRRGGGAESPRRRIHAARGGSAARANSACSSSPTTESPPNPTNRVLCLRSPALPCPCVPRERGARVTGAKCVTRCGGDGLWYGVCTYGALSPRGWGRGVSARRPSVCVLGGEGSCGDPSPISASLGGDRYNNLSEVHST